MTDINYKEGMKLTDEDWDEINRRDAIETDNRGCIIAEVAQEKCLRYLSSMELPELPDIWFCERKHQCKWQGFALNGGVSFGEIPTDKSDNSWFKWHEKECGGKLTQINANIQPIIAAQIGYREILRDDVVQLQNELDKQIVENEGLKAQLSTARAETAKEIKGKVITSLCPNSISAGQVDVIFSAYLAPDKEGGK